MVRLRLLLILLTFHLYITGIFGQEEVQTKERTGTIWDALTNSTERIDKFVKLIRDTKQISYLQGTFCPTEPHLCFSIFVPTNEALAKAYPSGVERLSNDEKYELVETHICKLLNPRRRNRVINVKKYSFESEEIIKFGQQLHFDDKSTMEKYIELYTPRGRTLYWTRKIEDGWITDYYVNNAREKEGSEREMGGGSIRVIHQVISPIPKVKSVSSVINSDPNYSEFRKIYKKFVDSAAITAIKKYAVTSLFDGYDVHHNSFFIPHNGGFANIPSSALDSLKANATALYEFVVSHVAYDQVLFLSWLEKKQPINLKMKLNLFDEPLDIPAKMYSLTERNGDHSAVITRITSNGVTARIYSEGQPLKNAVLFFISRPLYVIQ